MAWFKNGRKYWKHNGKIYSCKYTKRKKYDNNSIINSTISIVCNIEKKDKHKEAMEYRRILLKEHRNDWYSPAIHGSSIAISGTDDEILEIKRKNEERKNKNFS